MVTEEENVAERDFIEEIKVKGAELVDKIKELIKEGNVRKIVIKRENGETLLEIPMTAGVVAGGVVTLIAPVIAALGAAAAFLTSVKIEIHRTDESGDDGDGSAAKTSEE